MKAVLVYADGRREQTDVGGGVYIVQPKLVGGRWWERRFEAQDDLVDGCLAYREVSFEDKTEEHEGSARLIERWRVEAKQRHDSSLRTRAARLLEKLAAKIEGL